ncbi:hypothetical protein BDF19DRAFT_167611 [Syncephalis fuscata]|nr:hypothetical protein BDF19DRAFT_167611 [Syncephalis fuscata]
MSALCWMLAAGCSAFSRLMISLFLTTLVLFLAWPSTLVSAYIVFGDTNTNVSVPTVDYFQQSVKHYDRYGPMILPSFDQNASCTFKSPAPNPLVANTLARSGFSTVLAVNWTDAANSGCNNYGQVINALESIENAMQQSGFPVPFIILLMVPVYFPGPFGGPLTDKYLSHSAHTGNEFPRTDVAIMNIKDYSNFINNKDNAASTQYVRIVQEQGVWNRVFLSNGYVGITWTLFAINTVIILYGLYTLVMTLATRTFAADIRNVVFLLGIFAVIANATSIPLKNASYMRVVFEQISSFLSSIAFYMLLYLWSSLLSQIKQDRSMYPLRCFLFFGASVATWTIAINLIWLNHWDTSSIDSLIDVNFYLIPITQLMVAVLFCIVGYRFRSRRNQCRMSSDTQRALTK